MKHDLSYPIPKVRLIERLITVFQKLTNDTSATLLALPFTGRTSHLRFITSQKKLLHDLGVNLNNTIVALVDIDKTTGTYESFILEVIYSLETASQMSISNKVAYLATLDAYLLSQYLFALIAKITQNKSIYLIVTLNNTVSEIVTAIDNLLVICQKTAVKKRVNILWSIDTTVFRNYIQGHPSSTFGENITYFQTFTKNETVHSIERIALTKGFIANKTMLNKAFILTGGIAGLFHQFVNSDIFMSTDASQVILEVLKKEINLSQNTNKLATDQALNLISSSKTVRLIHKTIPLTTIPKAQEILLLDLFITNLNKPITRDQIAQAIWGKAYERKYSDWAIDKAISRLRKNIKTKDYTLITVKNLGYQLYKLT